MVENRQVMAKNILHFMEVKGVNATDVCKACGFKQNTFSDWVNGKTYPRIDKIETMANYFGVSKALLVEEKISADTEQSKKIRDLYSNIPPEILEEAENDPQLMEFIQLFLNTSEENRPAVLQILKGLQQKP